MKKRYAFAAKNLLRAALFFAVGFIASPNLLAQVIPPFQWDNTFGTHSASFHLYSIKQTSDQGFIFGGYTQHFTSSFNDFRVVKTDRNGLKAWDRTIGGNSYDWMMNVEQTSDGNFLAGGLSGSAISGDKTANSKGGWDFWLVKLDTAGNILWDKTIGGDQNDVLYDFKQTSDGGFLLSGSSNSGISGDKSQPSFGGHDFWVVKLRADGSKAWDRTIGGSGNDHLAKMLLTPDGGCILAGSSNSDVSGIKTSPKKGTNSSSDYWLVKLSSSGVKIWDKTFGGDAEEELTSLALTADGGYILGGHSKSGISADKTEPNRGLSFTPDYWVVKTDAAGNLQWEKTLGGNQEDEMYGVAQLADGNYLAGGWSNSNIGHDRTSSGYGSASFWLVKLDTAGAKMWDHSLGGYGSDILMDLQVTSDRGLILGGFSTSQAGGDKTTPKYGDYDTWIIKLGAGILNLKELKPAFDLTLFPNPSRGKFNLHLSGLTAPTAEVTVTDLLGRTILQQQFQTNNAQLSEEIRLPAASKGIYLLQVKTGGKITSRKIVVE